MWTLAALAVLAIDGTGKPRPLDATWASFERTPPAAAPADPSKPHGDPDALAYLVHGSAAELPKTLSMASVSESGVALDELPEVALVRVPCPAGVASEACAATPPIRVVFDAIDADHPVSAERSIEGVLGGALRLAIGGAEVGSVRIAGPRSTSAGPIERLRGKLRFIAVRISPGGALPVGHDQAGLEDVVRDALVRVNSLWGACGISFGPSEEMTLVVVDPPPSHLLAVGCDHGVMASGGEIRLRIGDRGITAAIDHGMFAPAAARRVARAITRAGFVARVVDNPRITAGAAGSSDVLVRDASGALVDLDPPLDGPVSTDATLGACIGYVNLEDGLQHFSDVEASVGTVEERTLLRAFEDADAATIDVYMIPGFARGGRIGESFIGSDGGTIENALIIDRAGIRTNQASFTLAHELGHVLLDDPGHPDDAGIDLPTRLMDADAADATAFGPRRLSLEECALALVESGPGAATPLLTPWPLAPSISVPNAAAQLFCPSCAVSPLFSWLLFAAPLF